MFKPTTIEFDFDKRELLKRIEANAVLIKGQRAEWKNVDNLSNLKLIIRSNEIKDPELDLNVLLNNSGPGGEIQINPKKLKRFKLLSTVIVFLMTVMSASGAYGKPQFIAVTFTMFVIMCLVVIVARLITFSKEKSIKKAVENAIL